MQIKGSAVKSISDFLKKSHPDKFTVWLNSLPQDSKTIFENPVLSTNWYSLREAAIVPTEILGRLLFNDEVKGAWQCGRFSAESALTGIYKFFIKAATPSFIVDRAGKIFSTYYQPSKMSVIEKGEDWVRLKVSDFDEPSKLIEHRIGGWIEKAIEIHGVSFVTVDIQKSMAQGDPWTEYMVKWGYGKN
ncbi:MAG TPA: hypothetical protein VHI78_07955 [Bacteroidales bacterium]|nr:hypothetical protein [Bacteroidales bacterium]